MNKIKCSSIPVVVLAAAAVAVAARVALSYSSSNWMAGYVVALIECGRHAVDVQTVRRTDKKLSLSLATA